MSDIAVSRPLPVQRAFASFVSPRQVFGGGRREGVVLAPVWSLPRDWFFVHATF